MPAPRLPDALHTPARSTRPPSNGNAGSRLNTATTRLDSASSITSNQPTVPGVVAATAIQKAPAMTAETAGPAAAMIASSRGDRGAFDSSETPPSR